MRNGRRVVLALCLSSLSACGFRPLYGRLGGKPGPAQQALSSVDVALIPERSGQLLRQALQQRLDISGAALAKRYTLAVSFGITADATNIQRDTTATRVREIATASWSLRRLDAANTLVTSGVARALDGVNVIDQQYFAADLESETIQKRLSETVADQITLEMAAYFANEASG